MAEIAATAETVAVDFEHFAGEIVPESYGPHGLNFAVATTSLTGVSRALMSRREAEELMFQMVEILGYKLELYS